MRVYGIHSPVTVVDEAKKEERMLRTGVHWWVGPFPSTSCCSFLYWSSFLDPLPGAYDSSLRVFRTPRLMNNIASAPDVNPMLTSEGSKLLDTLFENVLILSPAEDTFYNCKKDAGQAR